MIDLKKYLNKAKSGELLSEPALKFINLSVRELFKTEKNVIEVTGNFIVIGDIHGKFNQTIF